MPITPEHLSALSAYQMLWRSDAPGADVEAAFAAGFTDHRPGAPEAGAAEFAEHRKAALGALSGLSAHYEPIAGAGRRLAAHAASGRVPIPAPSCSACPRPGGTSASPKPTSCGCGGIGSASTGFRSTCSACSASCAPSRPRSRLHR